MIYYYNLLIQLIHMFFVLLRLLYDLDIIEGYGLENKSFGFSLIILYDVITSMVFDWFEREIIAPILLS